MDLNKKQLEAAQYTNGPILIIAGAGSGKTTVLSHRVEHLIMNENIVPSQILCVTFTNKAVNELKQRIISRVGKFKGEQVWVSTFHALARFILENEWKKEFSVTHTSESRQIVKKIIDNLEVNNEKVKPFLIPSKLMKTISLLKSELVTIQFLEQGKALKEHIDQTRLKQILNEELKTEKEKEEEKQLKLFLEDESKSEAEKETERIHKQVPPEVMKERLQYLRNVYKQYQSQLSAIGKIDVDDLLLYSVIVLATKPTILNKYHEKFRHIMIDEYQDTNRAQYVLGKLLSDKYKNICAVGDDFQSIYKFRGSDIRNILQFDIDFPNYKEIKLEENYRSTKIILTAANQIIAHNPNQKEKELYTVHEDGEPIVLHAAESSLDEARFIANQIKELLTQGFDYRDIAVFYRSNAESSHFETIFPQEEIPYMITKESSFFERKEIKDILSYLKFIHDSTDAFSFTQCVNMPKRGIGTTSVQRLVSLANRGDILESAKNPHDVKLNKNAQEGLNEFIRIISKYKKEQEQVSVSELITNLISDIQYKESFSDLETHLKKEKISYLNQLIEIAKEIELENKNVTLGQFVSELSKRDIDTDISIEDDFNKVNLLTIHSSKGLEFPVVFITGLTEEGFPSKYALTPSAIEEERRLCYVAFTRAKKRLFLTYSKTTQKTDENDPKKKNTVTTKPSRFLSEFDQSLIIIK